MSERTEESSDLSGVRRVRGLAEVAASMGILFALVVCVVVLYLTFLASIPPCSHTAWHLCPPHPGKTIGLALAGLGALALGSYGLVRLWASGWREWSRRKRIFIVVGVMIWLVVVPVIWSGGVRTWLVAVAVPIAVAVYHRSTKRPTSHSLSGPPPY
jgi:hypothetical protein